MKKIRLLFILAAFILSAALTVPVSAVETDTVTGEDGNADTGSEGKPLIRRFIVTENGNGVYRAEWDITNVTETVFVRIFAAQSKDGFNGTLAESIESGTHGAVDIYMPDIDSGYYIFYMSATSFSGVAGYKYSDNYFFFDNVNRQAPLTGVSMCREENDLYVRWNENVNGVVLLYDSETGELISRSDPCGSPCSVKLARGHKGYIAGAADCTGGILGRFEPVDFSTLKSSDAEIIIPSYDVTKEPKAEFSVKADGAYSLKAYNNGSETDCASVSQNRYAVDLKEGENSIMIFLTDADGKMTAVSTEIVSDTIAPELVLVGQTEDITTVDEEITLKGYVDDGAVLKYLGEEVELAGGYFYLNEPIGFGKNQFTLVASDKAGNTVEKTVSVERIFWSQRNLLLILLIVSVAVIAVVEFVLLFFKSDSKRKQVKAKGEGHENQQ